MRKRISKRRWIARYRLGKTIPRIAIENNKGLWDRMNKIGTPVFLPYIDFYKLEASHG